MRDSSWGWFLGLLAVATGLRFFGLGDWSLDGDELYSWYDVQLVLGDGPWSALPEGVRTFPVGYLAMALAVKLLGLSESALRLVPALSGVATVAVLARMRRDIIPASVGWAAAVLAACSPWLIYHSQTARFYGPLLLLSTLSLLWSLPGAHRRAGASLAAAVAAIGCHPTALMLLPGLMFATLSSAPSPGVGWRRLLPGAVLAGVGCALAVVVPGTAWRDVLETALDTSGSARYGSSHFIMGLAYNLGPVVGLAVLYGCLNVVQARVALPRVLVVFALAGPSVLLLAALLGVSSHQRYAMAAVPALLLLAGWGWGVLTARRPRWGVALALAALLLPLPQLRAHYDHGNRHDWRSTAAWIAAHAAPEDIIVADEHATLDLYLLQHAGTHAWVTVEAPVSELKQVNFLGNRRDVWVVVKVSRMGGAYGAEFDEWLQSSFVERARLGADPSRLVQHDNRLVIFQRSRRILEDDG